MNNAYSVLVEANLESVLGRKIKWQALGYKHNGGYGGIAVVKEIKMDRRPIVSEVIEGDRLDYAFKDELNPGHMAYSDSDRFVTFIFLDGSHLVIKDVNVNNDNAFIVTRSEFINRYQLNPGVNMLHEGSEAECITYCQSL